MKRLLFGLAALLMVAALGVPSVASATTQPRQGAQIEASAVTTAGAPQEGIVVDLYTAAEDGSRVEWLGDATTTSDGVAGFQIPPGCYVLTFIAPAGGSFVGNNRWYQRGVCVESGEVDDSVTAVVQAGSNMVVSALVTDDGRPAVGVVVDLFQAMADGTRGSWLGDDVTGDRGVAGFEVGAGCYVLTLIAPEGRTFESGSRWAQDARCADDTDPVVANLAAVEGDETFELSILHVNDHHSHLDGDSGDLEFNGKDTRVEFGGFSRVVAKIDELEAASTADGVVKIHAGDAITGTLFYTLFGGEADAAMMNEACFDIFELGNHEFDGADEGLKTFLDFLAEGDCGTEVLGANVVPEVGTPLAPNSATDYIKPFTVREVAGNKVGFVGIDIADKTRLSSSPLDSTQFLDEIETAQATIDELGEMGIDNIVVVTHIQLANDVELAGALTDVDVIVGGDSHTLLGDFDEYGLNSVDSYPVAATNADGDAVCIVQAWQYSWVVGEANVTFDGNGGVEGCSGTPHLLLGDTFLRPPPEGGDRVPVTGDELQEVMDIIAADPQLSIVTPDSDSDVVLASFSEEVEVLSQQVIGEATEDLCLERIPGQGRSQICELEDTAVHGGDIQQLVAEAFLRRAFEADIAIQNSGGVRIDIPAGDISIADAYELLPFANTAIYLDMTGAEIRATIEEGIDFSIEGSTGAYPYAAGLRFDVDMTQAMGSRASNYEIRPVGETEWVELDDAATYKVVANSFIASGGDNYLTMEAVNDDGRGVDTFIDYAQAFIDYVEQDRNGSIGKLPVEEYSTKSFVPLPAE